MASSTVVVNYCASPETLRDELLDRAFQRVLPHLYEERRKVMKSLEELRSALKALDDKLLVVLEGEVDSNAITSHTVYVSSIVDNKHAVYTKLQELEQIISTLDTIKDGLQAVAKRGAMLYSIGTSLRGIQREYHLSLPFFLWMFDQAVGEDPPEDNSLDNDYEGGLESDEEDSVQQPSHSASTKLSRVPRDESLEDGQRTEEDGVEGTGEGETPADDQPLPAQEDTTPTIDVHLPHVRDFPSDGVEYNSLSANHVKQLVDSLTQTVFQNVRQSLYEEHRLLFVTMICLNIQYETLNIFSEEELSLLLQGSVCKQSGDRYVTYDLNSSVRFPTGNPGLGTMDLTLKDFDSDASPPEFLPSEKWEDLMAVSVLPGPLDGVCVQLAENPEPWEKWYRSEETEMEPLPLRPTTSAQGVKESNEEAGCNLESRQSTPDLGDLSDFHQLILLRLLRPDRFTIAASKYVSRHLTVVKALPTSIGGIVRSVNHQLGVLILMSPTPACGNTRLPSEIKKSCNPTEILREYAKRKSIPFQSVTLGEGTESHVSMMIDAMADKEGWLVLESLHLASQEFLSDLKHQLVRGGNTGGPLGMLPISRGDQSRCCIWMTSEPFTNIPYFLIQNLRIITWDNFTPHIIEEGEPEGEVESFTSPSLENTLKTAILSSLKSISASHQQTLQEGTPSVRAASYAICVVHGLLVSRQMFGPIGLSKLYSLNDCQISHGIDIVLGSKFKEQNGPKELSELGALISELVYSNIISDSLDQIFVRSIIHHVLTSACSPSGSIELGNMTLATPPANVDVADFAKWLNDRWSEREDSFIGHGFNQLVKRSVQRNSGMQFLRYLGHIYELQHTGPHSQSHLQRKLNLTKVQNAVDAVSEKLPPLLDLGELPLHIVNEAERYTFPYHAPSLMSLLSVATNEMPQSIGFVLLQECHWLNSLLCHVRQSLHQVELYVLGGEEAMPEDALTVAKALQEDAVPSSWVHSNRLPCGHSVISWVADLKKRHDQMRTWIKEGKVPGSAQDPRRPLDPHGYLSSMWLGGLVNPCAVVTALRLEKTVLERCLLSEVGIACEVRTTSAFESTESIAHEGGLYLTDVYLEGAAWDDDKGVIVNSRDGLCLMPKLYIYPTLINQRTTSPLDGDTADAEVKRDDHDDDTSGANTEVYSCPVFLNSSRQVCSFELDLSCLSPSSQWKMKRVAIILDPGVPEDGPRKWPKPAPRPTLPKSPRPEQHQESSPVILPEHPLPEEAHEDIPPPSRNSRRSALGTIHEGFVDDLQQQALDGQSRSGSSRAKSQGSKRSASQQSRPSGQELEAMDEESDEREDILADDDEEEMDPEEFEAMLTARSMNLGKERHLKSVFDYRASQKKTSDNVNQNAITDVEREEMGDDFREAEEDEAGSHQSHSDDEERYEENGSDQDSYRTGSSRGSHMSGDENDVRPASQMDEDESDGGGGEGGEGGEGENKSDEEDELPNKSDEDEGKHDKDDEDPEEGTTKTVIRNNDDFFDTTSRDSAASQKMGDSYKVKRPSSGQSHKSDISGRSAGRRSLKSKVKDSSTERQDGEITSLKKQDSHVSNKSKKSEGTIEKGVREGSAGSVKPNEDENNVTRIGSQTSFKSAQGIYGQGKESMKRADSGGSRSSQQSRKGKDDIGRRKGSADSLKSAKKPISGHVSTRSLRDQFDEDEDKGKPGMEREAGDAVVRGDEDDNVRPSSAASEGRSLGKEDKSSRTSLNKFGRDGEGFGQDATERDEDGDFIGEERVDAAGGEEEDGRDKEEEFGEKNRLNDGENITTEMLEGGEEKEEVDEEGIKNDEIQGQEDGASQQVKDTRSEKGKSLLESMLENGDGRTDDGHEGMEGKDARRPGSPGEDSVDNRSIFDKEAPAY